MAEAEENKNTEDQPKVENESSEEKNVEETLKTNGNENNYNKYGGTTV